MQGGSSWLPPAASRAPWGFRGAGSHLLGQKLEKSSLFLGPGGVGMIGAMACGGERAEYQACFPPPAPTERNQLARASQWHPAFCNKAASLRPGKQQDSSGLTFVQGSPQTAPLVSVLSKGSLAGWPPGAVPDPTTWVSTRTHAPGCPRRASCPAQSAKPLWCRASEDWPGAVAGGPFTLGCSAARASAPGTSQLWTLHFGLQLAKIRDAQSG